MSMEQPPPPPPPPPPEPGGWRSASPANFSLGDSLSYGWNAYWKNVGPMLLIAVVVLAIQIAFSALGNATDSVALQVVLQLVGTLVSLLLTLGWLRVALEVTNGVKPELGDVFKANGYGPFILASILFYIGALIGFILLIIPGIIFIATFGFYGFVIAQRGDGVGVLESLQRSHELTRGHRWELFGMALVFLLVNIVGLLACIVGVIFTSGITLIAWAYLYRALSGDAVAAWQ
jgi:uncharacterized membrane protein